MARMAQFLVAPSILSADFARLGEEISAVSAAGADWIHVDVMDGHFVPNLTLGAPIVNCLKPVTKLPLDCHLMVENPEQYFKDFAAAGADYLTIHIESTTSAEAALKEIRRLGMKPGITMRPATPASTIFPYLKFVDLVLVMTVNPGFSGQSFMADAALKVGEVRRELRRMGHHALIEVDGGVNKDTALQLQDADVLVAGNAIFKASNYQTAISEMKKAKKVV
jgi:ribulose-phosphate 3-epimerase